MPTPFALRKLIDTLAELDFSSSHSTYAAYMLPGKNFQDALTPGQGTCTYSGNPRRTIRLQSDLQCALTLLQ
jgi:hypothetical protein